MIRYPFLIDQVLITNERNGTSIVLSRDEARQLYEQLGNRAMRILSEEEKDAYRKRVKVCADKITEALRELYPTRAGDAEDVAAEAILSYIKK